MSAIRSPVVVAETVAAAKDAAEAVELDIEAAARRDHCGRSASRDGAPLLYDDVPGNVALDYHYGDAAAVNAAFAKAAHVTRMELVNSRVVVNAMEPRAAVAAYDGNRFTFYVCSQGVTGMRANIAEALGVDAKAVHILTGQVGGSFGMKGGVFPEYICMLHARAGARPAGEVDRRTLRQLFFRQPRPQSRRHRRTRARRRTALSSRCASQASPTWARFSRRWRRFPGTVNIGEERAEHVSHAADRSLDANACSPTPRRPAPIAAPAGPRAIISWSG